MERIITDVETPVSAFLKLKNFKPVFLLESVEQGKILGRYSFIGCSPKKKIVFDKIEPRTKFWEALEQEYKKIIKRNNRKSNLRFTGGLVGYTGYDAIRTIEKIPNINEKTFDIPDALYVIPDFLVVFDHLKHSLIIVHEEDEEEKKLAKEIKMCLEKEKIKKDMKKIKVYGPYSLEKKQDFVSKVKFLKNCIRKGEIFQCVISMRFEGKVNIEPFNIYRALRFLNPSPYLFYLDFDDYKIIGSSPEVLVRKERDELLTCPIAGTRPVFENEEINKKMEKELLEDEKENAEHLMLVDLARNDLGKIALPGTIKVDRYRVIERFSHVMHLVTYIKGKVDSKYSIFDILKACFPAGTVTGAPKVRAMELIEESEQQRRGPYAGSVGYFDEKGNMDQAILIRAIFMRGDDFFYQAGAGIVNDSVPEKEWEECHNKGEALKRSILISGEI